MEAPTMFKQTITLNDGSEWKGTAGQGAEGLTLWVYIDGQKHDFTEVFMAFNDPEKVKKITAYVKSYLSPLEETNVYEGFTKLTDIKRTSTQTAVRLNKEV